MSIASSQRAEPMALARSRIIFFPSKKNGPQFPAGLVKGGKRHEDKGLHSAFVTRARLLPAVKGRRGKLRSRWRVRTELFYFPFRIPLIVGDWAPVAYGPEEA